MFQNIFVTFKGKKRDILENGRLSCAYFVSSILLIANLVSNIHTTVRGLEQDLVQNGWKKLQRPRIGAVLIWIPELSDPERHRHIGFYIGKNKAVSNSSRTRIPHYHHITFGKNSKKWPKRPIESIFGHPKFA